MEESIEEYRNRMRAKVWKPKGGVELKHPGGKSVSKEMVDLDLSPLSFKRGYIAALFYEDYKWINYIEKYHMIVPGSKINKLDVRRDLKLKEFISDQVHPDTYGQRLAYYQAWRSAKCCADDCDRYCDECDHGIQFASVKSFGLDADVRRFIERFGRFWLTSETKKALNNLKGVEHVNRRKVSNRKGGDDAVRVRGGEGAAGSGLHGESKEGPGNPFEGQEEMFLRPGFGDLVTCEQD